MSIATGILLLVWSAICVSAMWYWVVGTISSGQESILLDDIEDEYRPLPLEENDPQSGRDDFEEGDLLG